MTRQRWIVFGAALTAATILYAKVSTDYDHNAAFSNYRTYSWVDLKASNDLWKDRISSAVDEQLSAKGWSKVPSGGDASVSAYGSTKARYEQQTYFNDLGGFGWRYGWRGRWGGGWGPGFGTTATTTVDRIPVGTLVVDVFDTNNKNLIWQGESSETLSEKPDKNEKKLEKDVAEMFKKFPPEKG